MQAIASNTRRDSRHNPRQVRLLRAAAGALALAWLVGCAAPGPTASERAAQQAEAKRLEQERQWTMQKQAEANRRREEQRRAEALARQGPRTAAGLKKALKVGTYNCDLKRRVKVVKVSDNGNAAVFQWGKKRYQMKAVQANTGALRLENKRYGLVWIGVVGKSMLLDTKKGRQLANDCKYRG